MTTRTPPTPPRHRRDTGGDLRRAVQLFRQYAGSTRVYLVGLLLLLVEAGTAVVEPYPIAYVIDFLNGVKPPLRELGAPTLLSSERFGTILILTVAIILIAAVNSAADSLTEVCMARGGRSLGYSIRVAMYSHLQRLPLAYHDKKRTGDVLTRVTGDVLVVEEFVVKSVSNILGSLLVLLGSFAFMAYQSWNVALVSLVVVPILAVVSNHFSRRIKVVSKTQRDREGDLASTAQEMLTSIRLVQSYGRGTVDLQRFSTQTAKSMRASVGAANIQAQFSFVIALVEALSIAAVIWLGVWLVDRSAITIGTLVLFVLLLQNMFKPARKIVSEWYKIGKVFASVDRIVNLLDREVGVRDLPGAVPAPPLRGRLTFRHVSFAYPAEQEDGSKAARRPPVLQDVDFEVAPGEVVALVGFSGAGKSTIAQLVPRLYDPDEGQVLVDGLPLPDLTLASLRRQVSVVLQETVLLTGSVAENIAYGIDDATDADVVAAARMANAHEFIMRLPNGYATQLGERGATLSGGQRQRLAIARAFIRRAPVLILDEPTNGLDAESADSVVSALRSLMQGTTTIVISHDPGLVRCADRVLVISAGRIVESGRHRALLRAGGAYARLYAREIDATPGGHRLTVAGHRPTPSRPASPPRALPPSPAGPLLDRLRERLPGLAPALDEGRAADRVARLLLDGGVAVDEVSAGKLWLRGDGSCTVRYGVRLSGTTEPLGEHSVLARVHQDPDAARTYHAATVRRLPQPDAYARPPVRWRTSTAVDADAALTMHPFPVDPTLPTLPQATDPAVLARLADRPPTAPSPTVEVVHYPREGPCVLRYRFPAADGRETSEVIRYGKVYPDAAGDVVDGFLRALATEQLPGSPARFPTPVLYERSLRLLVTEGLSGSPVIPQLLKAVLASDPGSSVREEHATALQAAVRTAGEALAALQASDLSTAPLHPAGAELARLRAELEVVSAAWPEVADAVRRPVDLLAGSVPDAPEVVLSHGDFTPSQVLLAAGTPAVLDLDTLCWADPAVDLGRFLAHLELLTVKAGGDVDGPLAGDLAAAFLGGYGEASPRAAGAAAATDRIAFYKATTLARSAVHSCRQLKDQRLEIALSLLDRIAARS